MRIGTRRPIQKPGFFGRNANISLSFLPETRFLERQSRTLLTLKVSTYLI
ncbi:MAG: hypothetical protein F6K47_30125 [Symploca sp. SIO2E6]|nr:hypothetical protein [Symploca sp. SIO2E6]